MSPLLLERGRQIVATQQSIWMLLTEHLLTYGQHRTVFFFRLGIFAFLGQRGSQIASAYQGIRMVFAKHLTAGGHDLAQFRFCLHQPALGRHGGSLLVMLMQRQHLTSFMRCISLLRLGLQAKPWQ